MWWWPEKALASSISHTGCLHLSKTSHSCAVHTTSCSALQTLIKVLSPLPYLSFTISQPLFMCHSGDIRSQLFISRQSGFGCLPAPFGWGTFCFSAAVLLHMQGSVSASSSCHAQKCAPVLISGKIIAEEGLMAWSHRQSEIYLNSPVLDMNQSMRVI